MLSQRHPSLNASPTYLVRRLEGNSVTTTAATSPHAKQGRNPLGVPKFASESSSPSAAALKVSSGQAAVQGAWQMNCGVAPPRNLGGSPLKVAPSHTRLSASSGACLDASAIVSNRCPSPVESWGRDIRFGPTGTPSPRTVGQHAVSSGPWAHKAPPSATTPTAVPPPALSQSFEARSIPSMEARSPIARLDFASPLMDVDRTILLAELATSFRDEEILEAGVKRKQVFGKMQQQCILDSSTLLEPALEDVDKLKHSLPSLSVPSPHTSQMPSSNGEGEEEPVPVPLDEVMCHMASLPVLREQVACLEEELLIRVQEEERLRKRLWMLDVPMGWQPEKPRPAA
mmetsp:Transcript_53924/g.121113  ORF Transcript_53924/g.121113 Transcript_53924/m.121113 type:complete len:343 (+) Transcript_53924:137-1165(+)